METRDADNPVCAFSCRQDRLHHRSKVRDPESIWDHYQAGSLRSPAIRVIRAIRGSSYTVDLPSKVSISAGARPCTSAFPVISLFADQFRSPQLSAIRVCIIQELVTPEAAVARQIEHYRQMTGEQRLAVALELHELSCEVAREAIRQANPGADAMQVEQLLRHRLELARVG